MKVLQNISLTDEYYCAMTSLAEEGPEHWIARDK